MEKYGVKASSGGGRSSARETIGRVAAGAIAEKYLKLAYNIEIVAFVSSVGKVKLPSFVAPQVGSDDDEVVEDALSPEFVNLLKTVTRAEVDAFPTRCPHQETSELMTKVSDARTHTQAQAEASRVPAAHPACERRAGLHWRDSDLRDPRCAFWAR